VVALRKALFGGADDDSASGAGAPDWRDAYHARAAAERADAEDERSRAGAALRAAHAAAAHWGAAARAAQQQRLALADTPATPVAAAPASSDGFSSVDAVNAVAERGGHVVIINSGGDAWSHVEGVIAPMRRAFLPSLTPLIVLSPHPPPPGLFAPFGVGARVFCVRGSAQDAQSMLRAGVDTAARVLYLAGGPPPGGGGDDDGGGGGGALDRRAVLSTNILERHHEDWRREVFLTVELRAPASIKYLQEGVPRAHTRHDADGGEQADHGGAAAAAVLLASASTPRATGLGGALSSASAELRELRELRALLNKGLLSGQGALNALLGTELALLGAADAAPLPPVRASPALHARYAAGRAFFATDVCRALAHDHFTPGALDVLARLADPGDEAHAQALWLLPLPPPQREGEGRTVGALFATLAAQGATPLGLYRTPQGGGELAYVFTTPPPWVALQRDDAAYVLAPRDWAAQHIPEYARERQALAAAKLQAAWRAHVARKAAANR
jgi:hypothetical protein